MEGTMKRTLIACAIAAATSLAAAGAQAAAGHGGNWGGGHGGNWSGGHGGNWSGGHRFNGGFRGHDFHGNRFHGHGFRGFGSVFIGTPWWWGPAYYGYPVYYDYPAATYYYDDPSDVYIERVPPSESPAPQTRFYCPDTGYYPAVRTCPRGWLRVVPDNAGPQ
jgi:hypothetical protein